MPLLPAEPVPPRGPPSSSRSTSRSKWDLKASRLAAARLRFRQPVRVVGACPRRTRQRHGGGPTPHPPPLSLRQAPAPVEVSPHELEKAALRAQRDFVYERSLGLLQIELVKMAEWVRASGSKLVVIFEGRDAAGKGGVISRISSAISPRILRVVAPGTPSDREKTQWCSSHPRTPRAGVRYDCGRHHQWINCMCGPRQAKTHSHAPCGQVLRALRAISPSSRRDRHF